VLPMCPGWTHQNMARPARFELATLCLEACFDTAAIKGPILNLRYLTIPYRLLCLVRRAT
jgi:hypothetical protein